MDQLQQRIYYKDEILRCAHICGGVTGQHVDSLCPDETVLRMILESGRLHKIPIQVGYGKNARKITVFEDSHHALRRKSNALDSSSAKDMCYLNDTYLRFRNEATNWLDMDDIASIAAKENVAEMWKRPRLMFYVGDKLCGIILSRKARPSNDIIKAEIAKKFGLNRCIEILID